MESLLKNKNHCNEFGVPLDSLKILYVNERETARPSQVDMVRWIAALACFVVSGGVIAVALFPALSERKAGVGLLAVLLAAHLALSCGFMLVFFHAAPNSSVGTEVEKSEMSFMCVVCIFGC